MSGNTFGKIFKITTFGESHGAALGVVIDGVPSNIELTIEDIQKELQRRRPGQSAITTPRNEADQVEILSGIFDGKTLGTPIALIIKNQDCNSKDYTELKDVFRPGHADLAYQLKYGIRDYRGGGRSSGRETVARVAAGAIAKKILTQYGVKIIAYTKSIGEISVQQIDLNEIENNIVRAPDLQAAVLMIQKINELKADGDSIGGVVEAVIKHCPVGLGEPVFDKLEAVLGHALFSIGAVKGIEFGLGFEAAKLKGSEHNDSFTYHDNKIVSQHNFAGGILGGISTGEDIFLRLAIKPTPSIAKKQVTVDTDFQGKELEIHGRHDPCLCPRIVPVIEAMIAVTLVDFIFQNLQVRALKSLPSSKV
ncbi:MAG: chorismate synthase [Candidatus Margulisiibacteriota bacterium]